MSLRYSIKSSSSGVAYLALIEASYPLFVFRMTSIIETRILVYHLDTWGGVASSSTTVNRSVLNLSTMYSVAMRNLFNAQNDDDNRENNNADDHNFLHNELHAA